jgi:hypothetical protein
MTGSVLAAFCAAGVGPGDPDLARALALLHTLPDPETGGFIAPPESFGIGVNTDTTSWVTSGLIQCGIDPQGPEWTTAEGKTPLDYLVSLQRPDGHFDWTGEFAGGPFETFDSVRPLGGIGFSTEPPARLDGVSPAMRPAQAVSKGTTVPITMAIDHSPGADDVRMCRVDVGVGADLEAVLEAAEADSAPAGCVTAHATQPSGEGVRVTSLDGVANTADYSWRVGVDGSSPNVEVDEPIGFGDLVFLRFAPESADAAMPPKVAIPPVKVQKRRRARGPRVLILRKADLQDGRVGLRLHCPRGNGGAGCRGVLSIRFRKRPKGSWLAGGSAGFEVTSGATRTVAVPPSAVLRRALHDGRTVRLRITAATRAEDGSIRLTRARRSILD